MPWHSDLSGSNFRLHSETPHPVGSTLWILSTPHRKGFLRTHKWNFSKRIKNQQCRHLVLSKEKKKTLIFPHVSQVCADSCLTLYFLMDCSLPGSSVYVVFQARILEWVATSYSRGSSWPRDQTHISRISSIGRWILYHWATWEVTLS